jgi:hypothetical protein
VRTRSTTVGSNSTSSIHGPASGNTSDSTRASAIDPGNTQSDLPASHSRASGSLSSASSEWCRTRQASACNSTVLASSTARYTATAPCSATGVDSSAVGNGSTPMVANQPTFSADAGWSIAR